MKTYLIITALLGAIGVTLGALGAHYLETKLNGAQLASWNTAVKYQMIHVLVLLILGLIQSQYSLKPVMLFFLIGIFLFSGSIYLLSLKDVLQLGNLTKILGPLTPLGGLSFIVGWLFLAFQFFNSSIS